MSKHHTDPAAAKALSQRFQNKEARIAIVGMGYVGLPLALTFAEKGHTVVGLDLDASKVDVLLSGKSYFGHIPNARVAPLVQSGKLTASSVFAEIASCDAIIICVPTPLTRYREPDMSYVEGAARFIAPHLKRNQLVVLESTTYPGTTDELLVPLLGEPNGLIAGVDYFLAYSPEREDPGNKSFHTQTIPKVVGGYTATCSEIACSLYESVVDRVIRVSSTRVAEISKLLENIFRSVNIALVNELKTLCVEMKIDVWEAIDAAASKPFGYMPFYPGPGLGGHCIPIDPFYLTWKAREFGLHTRFIELAGEVNTAMPRYVVERVMHALNDAGKAVNGADILVLGVAYKRDVEDTRESPSMRLIELLQEQGAHVSMHDPYVASLKVGNTDFASNPLTQERLEKTDLVLIATDHTSVDYELIVRHAPLVVDTRNVTRRVSAPRKNVVMA